MATEVSVYIFKPPGGRRDGEECKDGDRNKRMTKDHFSVRVKERVTKTKRDMRCVLVFSLFLCFSSLGIIPASIGTNVQEAEA